jgi:hypothetical protein
MTFDYGAETPPSENLFVETVLNAACAQLLRSYTEVRHLLSGPPRLTNDQLRGRSNISTKI